MIALIACTPKVIFRRTSKPTEAQGQRSSPQAKGGAAARIAFWIARKGDKAAREPLRRQPAQPTASRIQRRRAAATAPPSRTTAQIFNSYVPQFFLLAAVP